MALVARASKTVRTKNLLILLMCVVFAGWFGYDAYVGYPGKNDAIVRVMKDMTQTDPPRLDPEYKPELDQWQGWNKESDANHRRMDDIALHGKKTSADVEGWKTTMDINVQVWIVYGLAAAVAWSIWWFIHCQRRRAVAEETTVSPANGVVIPWGNITLVDNNRWKSMGIVDITYTDAQGATRKAKFDDYELEREPLLGILEQLAEKAVNAEFIPKEEIVLGGDGRTASAEDGVSKS